MNTFKNLTSVWDPPIEHGRLRTRRLKAAPGGGKNATCPEISDSILPVRYACTASLLFSIPFKNFYNSLLCIIQECGLKGERMKLTFTETQ